MHNKHQSQTNSKTNVPGCSNPDLPKTKGQYKIQNKEHIVKQTILYTINDLGLKEIHQFLSANHKLGGDHFDRDMLLAWAADAEFQLAEGNPATIEIKSWDSIYGRPQEFTVSEAGIDGETVEIDD